MKYINRSFQALCHTNCLCGPFLSKKVSPAFFFQAGTTLCPLSSESYGAPPETSACLIVCSARRAETVKTDIEASGPDIEAAGPAIEAGGGAIE